MGTPPTGDTLAGILWDAEERFPGRPAVIQSDRVQDFRTLALQTRRFANLVGELGVRQGDRVVLLLPNSSQFVAVNYAVLSLGAVVTPLNPKLRSDLLQDALEMSLPTCVVTDTDHVASVTSLLSMPSSIRSIVLVGDRSNPGAQGEVRTLAGPRFGVESLVQLDSISSDDPAPAQTAAEDPAILFMTSGTTGRSKGILVSHRQALFGLDAWARRWNYVENTVSLMVAPFFHVVYNPLVLGAHRHGGAAVVVTALSSRSATLEAERSRATAFMGAPALFIQLLQDRASLARDLSSIDMFIYGGAPTPVPVIQELRDRFPNAKLFNCYGLTETCSALTCLGPEHLAGRESSVGLSHPGVEITVRDDRHRNVSTGELGEVYCRGPNVISSYYMSPEASAARFHEGWLRTGDIGYQDGESFLYLAGRADDRINVSGEKVYPADVENVLYRHPDVGDAAVIGVSDASRGQILKAFVVPKTKDGLDLRDLRSFCKKHLLPTFVPKVFDLVERLPRNPSGKVVRSQLKR